MDDLSNDEVLLMRYIDGELSQAEKEVLEERLASDAELKDKLLQLQVALTAIAHAATAERVGTMHKEMMAELRDHKVTSVVPIRKYVRITLTIAASVFFLIVGMGAWWLLQLSPGRIRSEHFVEFTVGTTRSMNETGSKIGELYMEKKYSDLILFASNEKLSGLDSLLVGISYYKITKNDSSIVWLSGIEKRKGQYKPDAQYYLGFAYLQNNNYDMAFKYLKLINNDKHHLYHQQVPGNLLRKIRALKWRQS